MERVGAVLGGTEPDRRPFTLTLSLYGSRLLGRSAADCFADPALYAAGQRAVTELCQPDVLFGPFALALEAEAFGSTLERFRDAPPVVRKPALKSTAGIDSLRIPDPATAPGLRFLVDSVAAVVADQGGARPVAAPLAAPCDLPIMLAGMDGWLETLMFDPALAARWTALAVEHFVALASAYFAAGAAFVVTPVMLVNPSLVNPSLVDRLLLPILREAFSRLPGPVVFHHGGNRIAGILPLVGDLPNVAGFVIDERDPFEAARAALGPGPLLLGNLSGPQCALRGVEDQERRVASILSDRKNDPRFIFATSGADVPWETDPRTLERLRRLLEAPS